MKNIPILLILLIGSLFARAEGERKDSIQRTGTFILAQDSGNVKKVADNEDTMVYEDYDDQIIDRNGKRSGQTDWAFISCKYSDCLSFYLDFTPIPKIAVQNDTETEQSIDAHANADHPAKILAYPNPVRAGEVLNTKGWEGALVLRDATGKVIPLQLENGRIRLGVIPGTYYLTAENGEAENCRIIVTP